VQCGTNPVHVITVHLMIAITATILMVVSAITSYASGAKMSSVNWTEVHHLFAGHNRHKLSNQVVGFIGTINCTEVQGKILQISYKKR
jgi:hypothetical protein